MDTLLRVCGGLIIVANVMAVFTVRAPEDLIMYIAVGWLSTAVFIGLVLIGLGEVLHFLKNNKE